MSSCIHSLARDEQTKSPTKIKLITAHTQYCSIGNIYRQF